MRKVLLTACVVLGNSALSFAAPPDHAFDDPLFQRCISWMLDGYRGALLQNVCMDEFELPQPSLFLCARKIRTGFASEADREGCAIIFEEEAKKVRNGYIK
jgi:hypothetical protein